VARTSSRAGAKTSGVISSIAKNGFGLAVSDLAFKSPNSHLAPSPVCST
jgi:hypothetical protein